MNIKLTMLFLLIATIITLSHLSEPTQVERLIGSYWRHRPRWLRHSR
jgi:hypothetical protein